MRLCVVIYNIWLIILVMLVIITYFKDDTVFTCFAMLLTAGAQNLAHSIVLWVKFIQYLSLFDSNYGLMWFGFLHCHDKLIVFLFFTVLLFYELSLVQDSILKRSKVEHRLKIFCKKIWGNFRTFPRMWWKTWGNFSKSVNYNVKKTKEILIRLRKHLMNPEGLFTIGRWSLFTCWCECGVEFSA